MKVRRLEQLRQGFKTPDTRHWGNLRHSHLYLTGHDDFFPKDLVGPARRSTNGTGRYIEILLDGLYEIVKTDIGSDVKTGKPRRFFRGRKWARQFFLHHAIRQGDLLALERIAGRRYRLLPRERFLGTAALIPPQDSITWCQKVLEQSVDFRRCWGPALGTARAGLKHVAVVDWDSSVKAT